MCIERNDRFNIMRNSVVASYGFTETIIEGQFWLNFLERIVGFKTTLKSALLKTTLSLSIFGPIEIFMFMAWTNYLEKSPTPLHEKIRDDFLLVFLNSCIFWVPSSFLCFYIIPLKFRAMYVCGISVIWDTFMSFAAHNPILHRLQEKIIKPIELIKE